jgi:two-component system CheB/CheR fusion protein
MVVGIGASAGGVEALTQFFAQITPDSGLAYVVILHLSPDYDSQLTQILQGVAAIPVTKVVERVPVLANHVYVVPPNQHLQMDDAHLTVLPNKNFEDRRAPVDIFFRTLAESHQERAIAVILSGTGADGSMGLKRIKERGGAVFVQNPQEAAFNEMPRHAIATDLVDDSLPVAELPARLRAYRLDRSTAVISIEPQAGFDQQQALHEVFIQLRLRTGHDFTNYKRPTMLRRIERRMSVRNLPDLPVYVSFLREHPGEIQALLKDLLISVTNFFRDSPVFTTLEGQLMPLLTQAKNRDDTLRIWVAGCATGEEAYSLAMLCAERTLDVVDAPAVQIFATDLDETALATAREGLYTLNDAADVSPERLRRFFTKEGDEYRIRPEIREMILFAHHNVLKDPPFSRLDLVSCRNLLIYFNQTAQKRALETFHFALNPGGYLLLGMAETTDGSSDLYVPLNREHHLFQSRSVATRAYPVPEITARIAPVQKRAPGAPLESETPANGRLSYGELHHQILEQYAPPSILVNEAFDLLHVSQRAGQYLQIGGASPLGICSNSSSPSCGWNCGQPFIRRCSSGLPWWCPNLPCAWTARFRP